MFGLFKKSPPPAPADGAPSTTPPPAPKAPTEKPPTFDVPATLPNLNAKTGADLAKIGGFQAPSSGPAPAAQTPAQFLGDALNQRQEALPATRAIAHTMDGTNGVKWAVDSCKTVQGKMSEPDKAALKAAEDYLAKPSPEQQNLAAAAAGKTDFQGPGGWAAKAASLAQPAGAAPKVAGPTAPAVANPSAECVVGAVALSAALAAGKIPGVEVPKAAAPALDLKTPAVALAAPAAPAAPAANQAVESAKMLKPFIDRGLQIAAGKA